MRAYTHAGPHFRAPSSWAAVAYARPRLPSTFDASTFDASTRDTSTHDASTHDTST